MRFTSFFKSLSGDAGLDNVMIRSAGMLADARHSFDLATLALLTDAAPEAVADDVHETDRRINSSEQELRTALIVHVSVQGSADIGSVLGLTLLLKKVERIGDQAKNILELAENGGSLHTHEDHASLMEDRQAVSALFAEAAELLTVHDVDEQDAEDFAARCEARMDRYRDMLQECLTSDRPARDVVPLAMYVRYLRRIVANLLGAVRVTAEPLPTIDYLEGGTLDTDD